MTTPPPQDPASPVSPELQALWARQEAGFVPLTLWVPREARDDFEQKAARARAECGRAFPATEA